MHILRPASHIDRNGRYHEQANHTGASARQYGVAQSFDNSSLSDATLFLRRLQQGDRRAADGLLPLVYDEFRAMAQRYLRHERPDHTLEPTALVHEAYMRLIDQTRVDWKGRSHFFAVAAQAMRRILVDHARHHARLKRGGDRRRVSLEDHIPLDEDRLHDLIELDEALTRLARLDERQARVVELRFFAGLNMEEVAEALDVSKRTVEGDWTMARAWLRRELDRD